MKQLFVWTMIGALLTLGADSASAFGFGKNKFEKEVEKEQEAVKLAREMVQGGYDLIKTAELKKRIDAGEDILIIDTMPYKDSYKKSHIPGAEQFLFPIPLMETRDSKETDGKSQDDYAALLGADKNRTIVVYCGFVKCTRSHNGALWAKKMGYSKVLRYPGGIFAWKGADYPTESAK
ncbi:MAG: rhodanese-like domain-containing protein [Candidatus Electrothrix sp. EH2]|nr:rhodanese-like domain-containing protein [Candidatus Electrothrix sp. EH2]